MRDVRCLRAVYDFDNLLGAGISELQLGRSNKHVQHEPLNKR